MFFAWYVLRLDKGLRVGVSHLLRYKCRKQDIVPFAREVQEMRYLEVYDVHARWRAGPGDPWQREHNVPRGGEQHTAVTAFRLQ